MVQMSGFRQPNSQGAGGGDDRQPHQGSRPDLQEKLRKRHQKRAESRASSSSNSQNPSPALKLGEGESHPRVAQRQVRVLGRGARNATPEMRLNDPDGNGNFMFYDGEQDSPKPSRSFNGLGQGHGASVKASKQDDEDSALNTVLGEIQNKKQSKNKLPTEKLGPVFQNNFDDVEPSPVAGLPDRIRPNVGLQIPQRTPQRLQGQYGGIRQMEEDGDGDDEDTEPEDPPIRGRGHVQAQNDDPIKQMMDSLMGGGQNDQLANNDVLFDIGQNDPLLDLLIEHQGERGDPARDQGINENNDPLAVLLGGPRGGVNEERNDNDNPFHSMFGGDGDNSFDAFFQRMKNDGNNAQRNAQQRQNQLLGQQIGQGNNPFPAMIGRRDNGADAMFDRMGVDQEPGADNNDKNLDKAMNPQADENDGMRKMTQLLKGSGEKRVRRRHRGWESLWDPDDNPVVSDGDDADDDPLASLLSPLGRNGGGEMLQAGAGENQPVSDQGRNPLHALLGGSNDNANGGNALVQRTLQTMFEGLQGGDGQMDPSQADPSQLMKMLMGSGEGAPEQRRAGPVGPRLSGIDFIGPNLRRRGQMGPGVMGTDPEAAGPAVPSQNGPGQMGPSIMGTGPMGSDAVMPSQMGPSIMGTGPMMSDAMVPSQMGPSIMGTGPMMSGAMVPSQRGAGGMMPSGMMPRPMGPGQGTRGLMRAGQMGPSQMGPDQNQYVEDTVDPDNYNDHDVIMQLLELERARAQSNTAPRADQGLHTIIIVDVSASMEGEPCIEAGRFISQFIGGLEEIQFEYNQHENVALICVGACVQVVQHFTNNYTLIRNAADTLLTGGPSKLFLGLVLPKILLNQGSHDNRQGMGGVYQVGSHVAQPRVIFISDGQLTMSEDQPGRVPDPEDKSILGMQNLCLSLVQASAEETLLKLYCVPVGKNVNMNFLEMLSQSTGGRIVDPTEAKYLSRTVLHHVLVAKLKETSEEEPNRETVVKVLQQVTATADDIDVNGIFEVYRAGEPDLEARDQRVAALAMEQMQGNKAAQKMMGQGDVPGLPGGGFPGGGFPGGGFPSGAGRGMGAGAAMLPGLEAMLGGQAGLGRGGNPDGLEGLLQGGRGGGGQFNDRNRDQQRSIMGIPGLPGGGLPGGAGRGMGGGTSMMSSGMGALFGGQAGLGRGGNPDGLEGLLQGGRGGGGQFNDRNPDQERSIMGIPGLPGGGLPGGAGRGMGGGTSMMSSGMGALFGGQAGLGRGGNPDGLEELHMGSHGSEGRDQLGDGGVPNTFSALMGGQGERANSGIPSGNGQNNGDQLQSGQSMRGMPGGLADLMGLSQNGEQNLGGIEQLSGMKGEGAAPKNGLDALFGKLERPNVERPRHDSDYDVMFSGFQRDRALHGNGQQERDKPISEAELRARLQGVVNDEGRLVLESNSGAGASGQQVPHNVKMNDVPSGQNGQLGLNEGMFPALSRRLGPSADGSARTLQGQLAGRGQEQSGVNGGARQEDPDDLVKQMSAMLASENKRERDSMVQGGVPGMGSVLRNPQQAQRRMQQLRLIQQQRMNQPSQFGRESVLRGINPNHQGEGDAVRGGLLRQQPQNGGGQGMPYGLFQQGGQEDPQGAGQFYNSRPSQRDDSNPQQYYGGQR